MTEKPPARLCVMCGNLHHPYEMKGFNWQWDDNGHPLTSLETAKKFPNSIALKGAKIKPPYEDL